ncbi:hypothetical protein QYE76_057730 [Lolium multiflorum]|uniref:RING-type domain-containing protein n=1 Tax=Lolium multiflorum TaxID=4521 RepID=A0AAD8T423_LOLMU|nr:hypothetical protein QYE76_057730 [Lolium multiflorum]
MATNGSRRSATAPPIQHRIEVHTICFNEQAAPAGKFAVCVACYARSSIDFCRLGAARPHESDMQPGENSLTTFLVADPATLRSAAACRGTLRGMLEAFPELQSLRLSEDEWDAVVPADVVPEIVGAAGRGNGFTFCFHMAVHRRVIHDERALLMATCIAKKLCSQMTTQPKGGSATADGVHGVAAGVNGAGREGLRDLPRLERESAVQMTGCEHAFHRRCISEWISKATCPMCRGDIWRPALPEILELSFTGAPAQDMPDIE